MKIVELRAENVKRLHAVRIAPDGNLVIIGGENAQGKSSVLDSIEMALGGSRTIPPDPVHRGSRKATIRLDLGDLKVELRVLLFRDGSRLDKKSLRQVAEMAAEHDCQVWLERVGKQDESAIIIEDGEVQGGGAGDGNLR